MSSSSSSSDVVASSSSSTRGRKRRGKKTTTMPMVFLLLLVVVVALLFFASPAHALKGSAPRAGKSAPRASSSSSSSSSAKPKKSSTWRGNAATKHPSDFKPFEAKELADLDFATFSSGEAAKAEARYGCLRDVYATNVGHSSVNADWRQRFKVGEKERVLMQGHRVSGDDVETVRVYYEGGIQTYKTLLDMHFQMLEPEPWVVRRGQGDSKMYAHALHPHTEEQLKAATEIVKEKREKRVGPRGERVATKIVQNLRKDDGAFNFRPAEREKQKSQLLGRVELRTTQAKWNTDEHFKNDQWVYNSTEAMFVNGYLAGACSQNDHDGFEKPHDDVENTLRAFEMNLERLESLGLVHLHPDVVMVPPLGGKKQLEKDREDMLKRQDRIKRGLSEFEDEFETKNAKEEEKKEEL